MNDLDMTFDTFRSEVLSLTSYGFDKETLREFYDDGYNVDDTVEWAEWKLDDGLFGDFA